MLKAYKVRLETNNKQKTMMRRCAGVSRYIYNWGLAMWQMQYEKGEKPGWMRLRKQFNSIKREQCPFVTEIPYAITVSTFRNLDRAFQNFFRRLKQGGENPGYPKFKSRKSRQSFQLCYTTVYQDQVRLTAIGYVKLSEPGYIPVGADYGEYATLSESAGEWYISVLVDDGQPLPELRGGTTLGMDVGIKSLAVFSDGKVFENPRALQKAEAKIKRLQRELARREKGSKNRAKTKAKLARCFAKANNIRTHAQHQVSNYAMQGGTIVTETLNVKGMLSNHSLARAVSDAGMSEIHRQIDYKAKWNGVEVIKADRWFASSKTCCNCGYKMDITLADRELHCPSCGAVIDRDLNAAKNLAALGERRNTAGLPGELAITNLVTENQEAGTA